MKMPVRFRLEDAVCDAYRVTKGRSAALHGHHHFLLTLITRGEGVQVINGQAHPWRAGGICFFSPTDFHEIRTEAPLRFYNISFDDNVYRVILWMLFLE